MYVSFTKLFCLENYWLHNTTWLYWFSILKLKKNTLNGAGEELSATYTNVRFWQWGKQDTKKAWGFFSTTMACTPLKLLLYHWPQILDAYNPLFSFNLDNTILAIYFLVVSVAARNSLKISFDVHYLAVNKDRGNMWANFFWTPQWEVSIHCHKDVMLPFFTLLRYDVCSVRGGGETPIQFFQNRCVPQHVPHSTES